MIWVQAPGLQKRYPAWRNAFPRRSGFSSGRLGEDLHLNRQPTAVDGLAAEKTQPIEILGGLAYKQ
jgi:hypothetical protein